MYGTQFLVEPSLCVYYIVYIM